MLIVICSLFLALQPLKSYAGGKDTIPPVLIVNGPDTVQMEITTTQYTWLSSIYPKVKSAIDAVDGNLISSVVIDTSNIKTTMIGIYPVIYSVSDLSGNKATVYRYIDIIDTAGVNTGVKPVIYLNGLTYTYVPIYTSYHDSGAFAKSPYFSTSQLQSRIKSTNNVNVNKTGIYYYTYTLTDSFGNVAIPVTRNIYVFTDTLAPRISLNSTSIDQVCLNSTFTDYTYHASDSYYKSSALTVDTLGSFTGTATAGLYYFRYKVTNPSGQITYSSYKYVYVLPANDDVCKSGAKTHEIDTTVCRSSCYSFTAPLSGSKYLWSNGDTTKTTTICTNVDTIFAVNITNGSATTTYVYNFTIPPTNFDCVWPGDANGDGVADNNDVLAIGIAYEDSGYYKRQNATTNWTGQPSTNWGKKFASGKDYNNADCNGDGYVDSLDISAVYKNYGYTHKKTDANGSPSDPPLSVSFDKDSAAAGDTVTATINLGTSSNPVSNAYGIAFSLNYSWQDIKAGKAKANLNSSWLGNQKNNLIYFLRDDSANGTIEIAITRTDHTEISGYGELGKVRVVMQDNLGGKAIVRDKVVLTPSNVNLISYNQTPIPLYARADSIVVTGPLSGISNKTSNMLKDIMLYPNPASQSINIDPGNQNLTGIRIVNEIGMVVFEQLDPTKGRVQIPVSGLNPGIYSVIINSINGTVVKQILKN